MRKFNVAYFTASCDSVEDNTRFAKQLKLDYPILSDPNKTFAGQLGCLSPRGMSNRWTYYIGKDGKLLHVDKKVKSGKHGGDIAAKLKELGVEEKVQ